MKRSTKHNLQITYFKAFPSYFVLDLGFRPSKVGIDWSDILIGLRRDKGSTKWLRACLRSNEGSVSFKRGLAWKTLRARHFSKNKGLIQFNQMKNWHTPNYRFGKSEGERQYIRRKLIFFFLISIVVLIDCISKFFEKIITKIFILYNYFRTFAKSLRNVETSFEVIILRWNT